jgi:tetratricopeptide (TPR) repeat protein
MKTLAKKRFVSLAVLMVLAMSTFAQAYLKDPKFGPDEAARKECATNLSLYGDNYNQRNFSAAKPYWQKVLQICPAARQNVYIHGVRMMKTWIEEERNPNRKAQLIDSLMMLYDLRIEHFDRRGILLGSKGMDLISYDGDRFEEAYKLLKESIEIEKDASESPVIFTYMVVTKTMYDNKKITAEAVIETYALLADYLDSQISARPDDTRLAQIKENVDEIFTSAGVADCDNLTQLFGPRINSNPTDLDLIKKTHTLLTRNRCQSTDFYRETTIKLFELEPTASIAYELARTFVALKNFSKVDEYYKRAIELEQESVRKSGYMVEYAGIIFNEFKNPQQARAIALQALAVNPNMGHALLLIGNIYASEKNCFTDEFQKKTVFWAAVDKFIRAKQVDPSLTGDCDKLIDLYVQYFPAQNDIFFQDLQTGQRYNVGCWINENTTVRARPQ